MTPHLVRWHNEFEQDGLVVIEVDDGTIDPLEDLATHIEDERIPYPVLHDENGDVCAAYGVQAYPTAYLLDRTGTVVWEGHPSPEDAETEIRKALAQ